ncbi:hypothetical protein ACFQGE_14000 [Halomicroarcula sp. GCM10025817]|nr:hypothetical protein [Halomicroarcula sp. SYNS111]
MRESGVRIEYHCRGCGYASSESLADVVACPRCHSISDHEQRGRGPDGG